MAKVLNNAKPNTPPGFSGGCGGSTRTELVDPPTFENRLKGCTPCRYNVNGNCVLADIRGCCGKRANVLILCRRVDAKCFHPDGDQWKG